MKNKTFTNKLTILAILIIGMFYFSFSNVSEIRAMSDEFPIDVEELEEQLDQPETAEAIDGTEIYGNNFNGKWPTDEEIIQNTKSYLVINQISGEVLASHNENARIYPASLTKIMTALVYLSDEAYDAEKIIVASETALNIPSNSSKIDLIPGEELFARDYLYGLMLASGNDCANVLAEDNAGNIEDFVEKMNEKAKDLGAENTHFKNPSGLHHDDHYTTAADMMKITAAAMQNEQFVKIASTANYNLSASNKHPYNAWKIIWHTSELVKSGDKYFTSQRLKKYGVAKTGTTTEAGKCLLISAEADNQDVIVSLVFGAPAKGDFKADMMSLMLLMDAVNKLPPAPIEETTIALDDLIPTTMPTETVEIVKSEIEETEEISVNLEQNNMLKSKVFWAIVLALSITAIFIIGFSVAQIRSKKKNKKKQNKINRK